MVCVCVCLCACTKTTRRGSRRNGPFYLFTAERKLCSGCCFPHPSDLQASIRVPPAHSLLLGHGRDLLRSLGALEPVRKRTQVGECPCSLLVLSLECELDAESCLSLNIVKIPEVLWLRVHLFLHYWGRWCL